MNAKNGLSCIVLKAEDEEDAIREAVERTDYWGDGSSFNAADARLIFSKDDIHIFEIED